MTALEVGTRFAGRYRLLAPVGDGAMGAVWRAYDPQHDRECALKLMRPELGRPDDLERFAREFRATARLEHPHCVRCFEHGVDDGRAYFTMEYVPGGSLELERWDAVGAVVDLGRQLLAGLDHVHAHGIIHRDLKPQNIFVEPTPGGLHARLGDLGIAKVADFRDEGMGIGAIMGSLRFLAPETLEHGTADPRSDLYALGLILYVLLDGEHPLGEGRLSAREWLVRHRRGQPRALTRSDVPAALARVVARMCARRPEHRYPSAARAYDALEDAASGVPGGRGRSSPPPLSRRPQLVAPAFVGRCAELERARAFCTRAREGAAGPCALLLEGAAGLGKSRLVRELLAEALDQNVMVLAGTCRAEGAAPYQPLAELMHVLERVGGEPAAERSVSQTRTRGPVSMLRRVSAHDSTTNVVAPDEGTPAARDASELSVLPPAVVLSPEDQAVARLRLHEQLTAQLAELCATRPVLVVVDDVQWADPPTRELVSSMARGVMDARAEGRRWPVGFILAHRPVADSGGLARLGGSLVRSGAGERLALGPLADDAAAALVASMLTVESSEVPETFAGPLLTKAEGSPLFLSQMMRLLLGQGGLQADERGHWRLDALGADGIALPVNVGRAIGERAARLATPSKYLLAAAAVVGRRFESSVVSAIVEMDAWVLLDGLDELVRAEFIEDVSGGYRFVHDRIRESVYDTLAATNRAALHEAAARALAARDGRLPRAWPGIAHHFERAGAVESAYRFALMAADHASSEYAHGAAEPMYDLAIRMARRSGTIEVDSTVWERRGDACVAMGRYAEASEYYGRRLEATAEGERRQILTKLGMLEFKRGRFSRVLPRLEQMLRMAGVSLPRSTWAVRGRLLWRAASLLLPARRWRGPLEGGESLVRGQVLAGECWFYAGDRARAIYYSLSATALARRVGPCGGSVRALSTFGLGLTMLGLFGLGTRFIDRAREFRRAIKVSADDACHLDLMTGLNLVARGRAEEALAVLGATHRRFESSTNAEALLLSQGGYAMALILAGRDYGESERLSARVRRLGEQTGDLRVQAWAGESEGRLALYRGQAARGKELLRVALDRHAESKDLAFACAVNDTLALFLALDGEFDEAFERGRVAAELVLEHQPLNWQPIDGGLVIAAALAKSRGERRPEGIDALVRRVLRRRRSVLRSSCPSALRFALSRDAWRFAHGRSVAFLPRIEQTLRMGFGGEAWVAHRVVAALGASSGPQHERASRMLRAQFERPGVPWSGAVTGTERP